MIQPILRRVTNVGTGTLNFWMDCTALPQGGFASITESVWPCAGVFRNLVVHLEFPPGDADTRTFTLYVNHTASALSCVCGSADTDARDDATEITIAVGDLVRLVCVGTAGADTTDVTWTIEFDSDTDDASAYTTNIGIRTTGFFDPFTGRGDTTATDVRRLIPCNGTITALFAANTSATIDPGESLDLYIYKNGVKQDGSGGTVNTLLTITDVAQDAPISVTFTLPLVRGDDLYMGAENAVAYPSSWTAVSILFVADDVGFSIMASAGAAGPSGSVVNYAPLQSIANGGAVWNSANAFRRWLHAGITPFTLLDLILDTTTDPGAGNTRTFDLLSGTTVPADTPQGVISNGSLTIDDTRYVSFVDGDVVGPMRHTPDSGPTVTGLVYWSLIIAVGGVSPSSPSPATPPTPGGEVPTGDDPAVADVPTGVIRLFARFTLGVSPYTVIPIAETTLRDPASWFGGYKAPHLLSVSAITRELSEAVRGIQVQIVIADTDRTWRTLATTDTLGGAFGEVFLVSDPVRYALGQPYRIFAGYIGEHRALPGFRYQLVLDDALSTELVRQADSPRIPPDKLSLTDFPGMTPEYEGRAVPIVIGEANDETELGNSPTTPQGVIPPVILAPSINFQAAWGGIDQNVIASIISQGALAANGLWNVYYNTPTDPYQRIPVPFGVWGAILWAPGMPGWSETGVATDYVDYPLPLSALTRRYTPLFIAADHAYAQAVLDGRILVAANVFGVTENSDGSGLYFSDAPRIYQWLLTNFLYGHWLTGVYLDVPHFSSGYSIINSDSIELATTRLRAFGGGTYPVGFMLGRGGEQQTLRHILDELCFGVAMEQGIDRHGRLMVDVEDPDAAADFTMSDLHDIEDGSFEVWVDRANYRNRIEYVHGYRYLPAIAPLPTPPEGETLPVRPVPQFQEWSSGLQVTEDTASIAANQGRTVSMFLENYVVRSATVAANWAERKLAQALGPTPALDGPRMWRLNTSWQALGVELGDVVAIDHLEGLGATGYEGERGRVLKITLDAQAARITLEGRILGTVGS